MTSPHVCQEEVGEPPGYWHHHPCGNKAKWRVKTRNADELSHLVCGVHVKWYRRWGVVLGSLDPASEAKS